MKYFPEYLFLNIRTFQRQQILNVKRYSFFYDVDTKYLLKKLYNIHDQQQQIYII